MPRFDPSRLRSIAAIACLGLSIGVALPAAASPSDRASTGEVEVRLISASSQVSPGQTVLVALEQRISPHWHTYWKNPGDSGQPTSIDWQLPKNITASDIHWPAPKRFDVGPITNYGYEAQVLLLTEIHLPDSLTPGTSVALTAEANWLVCREECIPQQATLALSLPVAASATPSPDAATLSTALSSLPAKASFDASARVDGKELVVSWPVAATAQARQALFIPNDWGRIQHAAKPRLDRDGDAWRLRMPVGEQPAPAGQVLEGLLLVDGQAWEVRMPVLNGNAPSPAPGPAMASASALGLWTAMGLALIGGLILNLMPCVFPVLAIKALGFLQGSASEHRRQGLAYTAGVLIAFAALGAVLLALRSAGGSIGWGFQFHSPVFVLLLAWLMFVLGLSLAGHLQIGAGFAGIGQSLASRPGLAGSFFTGVLATVVATPCTAPFMGAAMAFALAQPGPQLMAVFLSLGFGLALPYLALACWPALQRRMPRPGPWMEVLKQALAFPMFAAAIWLVWVLAQQAGPLGVLIVLSGMVLIALAAWVRMVSRHASAQWRWTGAGAALAAVIGAVALVPSLPAMNGGETSSSKDSAIAAAAEGHELYSPERLSELRAQGKPVFVNLTASWCITCLVNERVALSTQEVREAFTREGVTYLKGDWTRQDPRITALLKQHDRSGVPLYLFYPAGAGSSAQVLPQVLTPGIVTSALRAGEAAVR